MVVEGVLLVDKPIAATSHDVVAVVRKILKIKKIGHTGTLDPMATGVLALVVGKATRLSKYLSGLDKRYDAVITLGITTDTLDAEGTVLEEKEVNVTIDDIELVVKEFVGELQQVPPMFSAKKVDGKRLYELARQGVVVERQPKTVFVYDLVITKIELPHIYISVHCSSGTYIRVLAAEIGEKLGCGAHLSALNRTEVGPFTVDKSHSLEYLREQGKDAQALLEPIENVLPHIPKISVNRILAGRIIRGEALRVKDLLLVKLPEKIEIGEKLTVYYQDRLIAIAHVKHPALSPDKAPSHLAAVQPERVLVTELSDDDD